MSQHKPMPVLDDKNQHPDPHARGPETVSPSASASLSGDDSSGESGQPAQSGEPAFSMDQVKLALRKVKDPELNLNILDLGLIYAIDVDGSVVKVDMSLTSPGCPSGPEIMTNAEQAIRAIPGVSDVMINLVWSPYWTPDRIEPRIRAYLGL